MAARFGNGRRRVGDGRRLDFLFRNSLLKYYGRSFCEENMMDEWMAVASFSIGFSVFYVKLSRFEILA
jgi:hypothetical protein